MKHTNARTEEHFSAGGIVFRTDQGKLEVVLCGRDVPTIWCLPKGTPDSGESIEQTALREVREETGLDVAVEDKVGEIEYWFARPGARVHKRVVFYLMKVLGGSIDQHDKEFDRVSWFEAGRALQTLTYPNEATILGKALALVKAA